jgi:head-tail adaptor
VNVAPDRLIWFDSAAQTQDAKFGASTQAWTPFVKVYAERMDVAPSRQESVRQGLANSQQQRRYRFRWRDDVDSSMRVREGDDALQIIGGPSEIGPRHSWMEIVCVKLATTGGGA